MRRVDRIRQSSDSSLQGACHKLDNLGRKGSVRKILHGVGPKPTRFRNNVGKPRQFLLRNRDGFELRNDTARRVRAFTRPAWLRRKKLRSTIRIGKNRNEGYDGVLQEKDAWRVQLDPLDRSRRFQPGYLVARRPAAKDTRPDPEWIIRISVLIIRL